MCSSSPSQHLPTAAMTSRRSGQLRDGWWVRMLLFLLACPAQYLAQNRG